MTLDREVEERFKNIALDIDELTEKQDALEARLNRRGNMAEEQQSVEAEGPGGLKIKARGTDVVIIAASVIGGIMLYMLYDHKAEAKENNVQLVSILKEMNSTNKELVTVQRVTNCLISKEQTERRTALIECERIAR